MAWLGAEEGRMSLRRAIGQVLGASRWRLALPAVTPALHQHAVSRLLSAPRDDRPRSRQLQPQALLQQPFACGFATASGTKRQGGEGPAAGWEGDGGEGNDDAILDASFELVEIDFGGGAAAGESGGRAEGGEPEDGEGGFGALAQEGEAAADMAGGGDDGGRRRRRRSRSNLGDHYA